MVSISSHTPGGVAAPCNTCGTEVFPRTCTSMAPPEGHSLGIVLSTSGAVSGAASGSGLRY